jgi:hypothetical protein
MANPAGSSSAGAGVASFFSFLGSGLGLSAFFFSFLPESPPAPDAFCVSANFLTSL